jgi:hypothetical protein
MFILQNLKLNIKFYFVVLDKNYGHKFKYKKMFKSKKSQLACSYCSKIFKDPIQLPCDDSICREHLSERDVVKENCIKCNECNKEFVVKENEFKSSNALKKLIESQSYSSKDEKIRIKQELEVSLI